MVTGTGKVSIETLQRLVEAFNAHDLDAVMSFFVDDPVLEMPRGPHPWGRRLQGREEVRAGLASRFAGIPDVHYGEDRHWVSGDRGCSEWLLTGTTTHGERVEATRSPGRTPTGSLWSAPDQAICLPQLSAADRAVLIVRGSSAANGGAQGGTAGQDEPGSGVTAMVTGSVMGEARPGRYLPRWQHCGAGAAGGG